MTNLVFFGSSPFSIIVLEKLLNAQGCTLCAVVTTPDKPTGRHLKLTPNQVKVFAQKNNIPILETMNDYRMPMNDNGMTVGLVAAYGKIIPQSVIDAFGGRIYNIHPSLLPKYRGPSPLQQQILDGVTETGVTIIQLDAQIDHGPIVAVAHDKILPDDTTMTLGNRLFEMGAELFLKFLNNSPLPFPSLSQREGPEVSYTKKFARQDGFLPWEKFNKLITDSTASHHDPRLFRAFYPWPGVWTLAPDGKRVKLIQLHPILSLS